MSERLLRHSRNLGNIFRGHRGFIPLHWTDLVASDLTHRLSGLFESFKGLLRWSGSSTLRLIDGNGLDLAGREGRANLLHLELVLESGDHVVPLNLQHLCISILFNELGNGHVAATDSHLHLLVLSDLHVHFLRSELIHAFRLSQKQNFHLVLLFVCLVGLVGLLIQVLTESLIDRVLLVSNVAVQLFS